MTLIIHDKYKVSENDTHVFFVGGPLSNWYPSKFTRQVNTWGDPWTFENNEQYMMFSKARLFHDEFAEEQIMKTSNPKELKALGRMVGRNPILNSDGTPSGRFYGEPYDDTKWKAEARYHVMCGAYSKFSQNPQLAAYLLSFGLKHIVEGAWYDEVWGVKLAFDDPRIEDPANWQGMNWLGEVLMTVRHLLRIGVAV